VKTYAIPASYPHAHTYYLYILFDRKENGEGKKKGNEKFVFVLPLRARPSVRLPVAGPPAGAGTPLAQGSVQGRCRVGTG